MAAPAPVPRSSTRLFSRLAAEFDPSQLVGHFVLGRSIPIVPDGWRVDSLDGWLLACEASLPSLELVDGEGRSLGWILGRPLTLGVGLEHSPLRVPVGRDSVDFHTRFEQWLYAHAGQFVAALVHPAPLIYVDTFGSLPVLFDSSLELASSSPYLLTEDGSVPERALTDALDIERTGSWFILGSTPHARAERLVPNHVLDLRSWEARRHWPAGAIEPGDHEPLIGAMADALEGAIKAAAAATGTANVAITAGADSRCLLACSRGFVDSLRFFTVPFPDGMGDTDIRTAPRVAGRFGLDYRLLEWIPPSPRDVDRFLYQTGCLIGEKRGRIAGPTYAQLGPSHPYVSGIGTITVKTAHEVGLTDEGAPRQPTDPRWLLRYFWMPQVPELLDRATRWLEEAPPLDAHNLRVLFHMEMRYGGWGGALGVGYPDACSYTVYPFGQRAVADAVFQLPLEVRLSGSSRRDATALRWPDLLEIPINHPTRRVAVTKKVKRATGYGEAGVRRAWRLTTGLIRAIFG